MLLAIQLWILGLIPPSLGDNGEFITLTCEFDPLYELAQFTTEWNTQVVKIDNRDTFLSVINVVKNKSYQVAALVLEVRRSVAAEFYYCNNHRYAVYRDGVNQTKYEEDMILELLAWMKITAWQLLDKVWISLVISLVLYPVVTLLALQTCIGLDEASEYYAKITYVLSFSHEVSIFHLILCKYCPELMQKLHEA